MIVFWTENDPVGALRKELVGNWRTTLKVGIPAFLYTIQNNLLYYALTQLDATVYQVLYQVKLLTTAMFSVVLLQRSFSTVRWVSLGVLALGVALVQVSGMKKNGDEEGGGIHMTLSGLIALFIAACLSGLAGVWFEKMLKNSKVSIWMRNIQLGLFSIMFATLSIWAENTKEDQIPVFNGFDSLVLCVIILSACGGLLVAVVMKYADNIIKGFATSISIIVTSVICIFIPAFQFNPTPLFLFGTFIVMTACCMYNLNTWFIFPGCEETITGKRSSVDNRNGSNHEYENIKQVPSDNGDGGDVGRV